MPASTILLGLKIEILGDPAGVLDRGVPHSLELFGRLAAAVDAKLVQPRDHFGIDKRSPYLCLYSDRD